MRDLQPIVIDQFKGWYRNGPELNTPLGYGPYCDNIDFTRQSFKSRPGFVLDTDFGGPGIIRVHNYQRSDSPVTPRYFVLMSNGELYDTGFSLVSPILTVIGVVDFSVVSQFNRAYFSFHDRVRGKLNSKVIVWDPAVMTSAREAGGVAPATGPTAVTGAAGNVAGGKHLISVAYETNTGFITKPGPSTQYTAPGNAQINLSAIPTGPVGVITKRHILVTPIILSYDGNPQHYEHFFVATIEDNTTTVLNINFIDSALVQSADYLYDQLERIPAGVGFCLFQGCLISYGENVDTTVTPNKEQGYLMRVSKSGQPESHSAVDGYVQVDPADGGGVKNATELRGLLFAGKSARWYNIQPNDGPPNTWLPVQIDTGIGCECFGLATIADDQGAVTNDVAFLASRRGIHVFNGAFPDFDLTESIKDAYEGMDFTRFSEFQLFVDPHNKKIYLSTWFLENPASFLLVGNYEDGLAPDKIKWSRWSVQGLQFNSILMDVDGFLRPKLKFTTNALNNGKLFILSTSATSDNNGTLDVNITANHDIGPFRFHDYGPTQYSGIYISCKGATAESPVPTDSVLARFVSSIDSTFSSSVTLTAQTGRVDRRGLYNFVKDAARIQITNDFNNSGYMEIVRIIVTGAQYAMEYPG